MEVCFSRGKRTAEKCFAGFCAIISLMDKLLLILSIVAFFFLAAMMFLTSPSEIGPLGVLVFFTLVYVLFLGLAVMGCRLFFALRAKFQRAKAGNTKRKSYYYGLVIALAPLLLLLCGSFGGIRLIEVGLVIGVEIFLCFLVSLNVL